MPRTHAPAVVIGASVGGLLAAQVLADHFPAVLLVDRDDLPNTAAPRSGTPQDAHVHVLFPPGLGVLEDLFPGFTVDFCRKGGHLIDVGAHLVLATRHGWGLRTPSGTSAIGASRPLLEHVLRDRVLAHPHVRFLPRHHAEALEGTPAKVTSVTLRARDAPPGTPTRSQAASLVVDASGRGSRLPSWLAALGCPTVPESVVDPHLGYASRLFTPPPSLTVPDWRACYVLETGPDITRGGVLAPFDQDRWIATLTGVGADRPTVSPDDFLPFARSLTTPIIADLLAHATPLTPVVRSNSTAGRRRHYDQVRGLPANVLALGDSACALNPLYAQGMTVAALSAQKLAQCLAQAGLDSRTLSRRYHHALKTVHQSPWLLGTTADLRYPSTRAKPHPGVGQRLFSRYINWVQAAGTRDPHTQAAFLDVLTLVRPPTALLSPRVLIAALAEGGEGTGPAPLPPSLRTDPTSRNQP
ncbi:NAD(P)/FAD-dependent oxidoreductase [Streptomyces atroolivaceus]|uniref:NAD(P)/FAD-dependent oxidoreductase n=1 Tax=Streptomyces atroolivaceus TaxID=66869 RepID=UPI00365FA3D7